jgi:phasin protein
MKRHSAPVSVPSVQIFAPPKPPEGQTAPTAQVPSVDHPGVEISSFDQASRQATTPLTRFNELSVRAIERAARYSYEVAGDSLSFTLANVHSVSQATDVTTLLQRSTILAHRFVAKQLERFAELATLTTESRAEFNLWLGESASELAASSLRIPTQ